MAVAGFPIADVAYLARAAEEEGPPLLRGLDRQGLLRLLRHAVGDRRRLVLLPDRRALHRLLRADDLAALLLLARRPVAGVALLALCRAHGGAVLPNLLGEEADLWLRRRRRRD